MTGLTQVAWQRDQAASGAKAKKIQRCDASASRTWLSNNLSIQAKLVARAGTVKFA